MLYAAQIVKKNTEKIQKDQTYDLEIDITDPEESPQPQKAVQISEETNQPFVEKLQQFLPQLMTFPSQVQEFPNFQVSIVQQPTERKIQKPKKTNKQQNPTIAGKKLAQKKLYSTDKLRTSLPKRCGNKNCSEGQHYETPEIASLFIGDFNTIEKRNTYCPCCATIQYFLDNKSSRVEGSGNAFNFF